jgi:ribonucleoside-diphosphate reductase subunit M1
LSLRRPAQLNKDIFEAIYYGAVSSSIDVAERDGHYQTYPGSPASKGQLQFDMWGVKPSGRFDWASVKERLAKYGMRNSLLVAPMPTASTAQILGNNESIEPFTSNIYTRRVLAGEFAIVNKHLLKDLIERGIWTPSMRLMIIADKEACNVLRLFLTI